MPELTKLVGKEEDREGERKVGEVGKIEDDEANFVHKPKPS